MQATSIQLGATLIFAFAILHTFLVKRFQHLAHQYPEGSVGENFYHLLGEVEVVFGLWAGVLFAFIAANQGLQPAIDYLSSRDFTEPSFVFVILVICATRPVLDLATWAMRSLSQLVPLPGPVAFYFVLLGFGPLLGSVITEPAIMAVLALLLLKNFYHSGISDRLKYSTIGLLFVNVSIGGTLTPYAAPPVLMVAPKWGWDVAHMFGNFGFKAIIACIASTALLAWRSWGELKTIRLQANAGTEARRTPPLLGVIHLLFIAGVVLSAHHPVIFVWLFLFFLGLHTVTQEYQDELKLREGLLVAFFLAGLVVLGGLQDWWLKPVLARLSDLTLYLGATALTAFTDNAALTYLGAQVPDLAEASRYALVAGAVVGGGLTVIANAPNPAGYGILNPAFGKEGISPIRLFKAAILPTVIAGLCFWLI